jgi:hypothetical protein
MNLAKRYHEHIENKNNETFFGYKNHAKACTKSELLKIYLVTDTSVHDPQALDWLTEGDDEN